jgi:hypothetical protein
MGLLCSFYAPHMRVFMRAVCACYAPVMREKGGSPMRASQETAQQNDARRTILIQQLLSVVSPLAGVRPCIETTPPCQCTTASKDLVFLASILDSHRATRAIPFGCGRRPLFANRVGMARWVSQTRMRLGIPKNVEDAPRAGLTHGFENGRDPLPGADAHGG